MDTLIKDIRYGVRSLTKRPGFTVIAVITLALGIGASTAIFSVVDGVLLRPLPYPHAERIVQLREVNPSGGKIAFAEPNYLDLRARSRTLEAMAQYGGDLTTVIGPVNQCALRPSGFLAISLTCLASSRSSVALFSLKKANQAARR